MKKIMVFICLSLILVPIFAFSKVPSESIVNEPIKLSTIFDYLVTNWVSISLIISEIAALLSVKYSGILKTALSIFDMILRKKKGSSDS